MHEHYFLGNLLFRAQRPMNVRPAAPFNRSTNNNPPRYGYDENVYQQQYPRTNYQYDILKVKCFIMCENGPL